MEQLDMGLAWGALLGAAIVALVLAIVRARLVARRTGRLRAVQKAFTEAVGRLDVVLHTSAGSPQRAMFAELAASLRALHPPTGLQAHIAAAAAVLDEAATVAAVHAATVVGASRAGDRPGGDYTAQRTQSKRTMLALLQARDAVAVLAAQVAAVRPDQLGKRGQLLPPPGPAPDLGDADQEPFATRM